MFQVWGLLSLEGTAGGKLNIVNSKESKRPHTKKGKGRSKLDLRKKRVSDYYLPSSNCCQLNRNKKDQNKDCPIWKTICQMSAMQIFYNSFWMGRDSFDKFFSLKMLQGEEKYINYFQPHHSSIKFGNPPLFLSLKVMKQLLKMAHQKKKTCY